ncbi:MAG: DUF5667 domain-containing protein [Chloroflexi bacterium]|nr:DUF5667 domain-containing protein [Chloroflexota bacterium]
MKLKLDDLVLEQCVNDIRAGRATVADCLSRYPDQADELAPLLEMAVALHSLPDVEPSQEFKQATRQRLLRLQPAKPVTRPRTTLAAGRTLLWRTAAAIAVAVLLLGGAAAGVNAAGASLPGSALYPFKRAMEQLELNLTSNSTDRTRMQLSLADRRLSEAAILAKAGQDALAAQALNDYGIEVDAASQFQISSAPTSSITQEFVETLKRQQQELSIVPAGPAMKEAIQDALDATQGALEHFASPPASPSPMLIPSPLPATPVLPTPSLPEPTGVQSPVSSTLPSATPAAPATEAAATATAELPVDEKTEPVVVPTLPDVNPPLPKPPVIPLPDVKGLP